MLKVSDGAILSGLGCPTRADSFDIVDQLDAAQLFIGTRLSRIRPAQKLCRFLDPVYWLTSSMYALNIFPGRSLTVTRDRTRWMRRRSTSSLKEPDAFPVASLCDEKHVCLRRIDAEFYDSSNCSSISRRASGASRLSSSLFNGSCSPAALLTSSVPILDLSMIEASLPRYVNGAPEDSQEVSRNAATCEHEPVDAAVVDDGPDGEAFALGPQNS